MPKDFLIDSSGNRVVRNGDFVLIEGADFIKQSIYIRLRIFLGEYFLNVDLGVDYKGTIYDDPPKYSTFNSQVKQVISTSYGVLQLLDYQSSMFDDDSQPGKARKILNVYWRVQTIDGTLEGSEAFG